MSINRFNKILGNGQHFTVQWWRATDSGSCRIQSKILRRSPWTGCIHSNNINTPSTLWSGDYISECIFTSSWEPNEITLNLANSANLHADYYEWIIFSDGGQMGEKIARRLEEDVTPIHSTWITSGCEYSNPSQNNYVINPEGTFGTNTLTKINTSK